MKNKKTLLIMIQLLLHHNMATRLVSLMRGPRVATARLAHSVASLQGFSFEVFVIIRAGGWNVDSTLRYISEAPHWSFFCRRCRHAEGDWCSGIFDIVSSDVQSFDDMLNKTVPATIQLHKTLKLSSPLSSLPRASLTLPGESEMHAELKAIVSRNKVLRSFIGMGYYGTNMPAVIQRSIFENPGWCVGVLVEAMLLAVVGV